MEGECPDRRGLACGSHNRRFFHRQPDIHREVPRRLESDSNVAVSYFLSRHSLICPPVLKEPSGPEASSGKGSHGQRFEECGYPRCT
jgi:hypothetical protein